VEGKPMNPEKNPGSKTRAINKFNPYTCMAQGQNGTKATWKEGDERQALSLLQYPCSSMMFV